MYRDPERDLCEKIEDIERAVEALMSQSPAISGAFDRVNSTSSDVSQLSLYPSSETRSEPRPPTDMDFSKPRRPPRLSSLNTSSRDSVMRSTESYSPAISRKSSPGIPSGSEIASSEPTDGRSSVGQPSPSLHRPIVMWTKSPTKPMDRRAAVAKSLPTLPVTPEIEPGRRRSNSESNSIRLPSPAVWDDSASGTTKPEMYKVVPDVLPEPIVHKKHASTISQQDIFEKSVFQNSAIYCDLSVYITPH
jgi:hypothetical protein